MQSIVTFLLFDSKAEEAIKFYVSLFKQSQIINITYYSANEAGEQGSVKHATFSLKGQEFMCIDSKGHNFTFTPATSLFVNCESEDEIDELYENLSREGIVMMALGAYPFSKKYCFISDKYGVSWQLSLVDDK